MNNSTDRRRTVAERYETAYRIHGKLLRQWVAETDEAKRALLADELEDVYTLMCELQAQQAAQ